MPVLLALGRLREKDHGFEASLGYIGRTCLKSNNSNNKIKQKQNQGAGGSV
jgi:hypothetical protein